MTTEMTTKREIGIITAEIITIREHTTRMLLENSIEIGRRLLEAKEIVGHGGWGDYLREKVDFSPSTANNLMKLCQEYGDTQLEFGKAPKSQTFGNLTYSQAVALLALPEQAREEVVAEHDMETTSVRELQAIIEEKKLEAAAAKAEAEHAKKAALDWEKAAEANRQGNLKYQVEIKKRDMELRSAREELKKLESRPVEVAVRQPSEEELEAIRREAEEEVGKRMGEEITALREELAETKKAGEQQSAKAAKLEKQLAVAGSGKMVEFNILLKQFQEDMEKLHAKHIEIQGEDQEKAMKLKAGMVKILQMMAEKWKG